MGSLLGVACIRWSLLHHFFVFFPCKLTSLPTIMSVFYISASHSFLFTIRFFLTGIRILQADNTDIFIDIFSYSGAGKEAYRYPTQALKSVISVCHADSTLNTGPHF